MKHKVKILFVDDEPRVLDGLRRMLRHMRNQWDMTFVTSAHDALQVLAQGHLDVIVSDMRMPQMDGLQLFEIVKHKYPQVVRIALSGETSKETTLRSVGPIHQYLQKPCSPEDLRNTIAHVCSLQGLLLNDNLQGLISELEALPCLPSLYTELIEALESDETSTRTVGQIISRDLGMTTKILQLVNSAFFGIPQHISSISQAVTLLGLETINALVLSVKVFSHFENIRTEAFSLANLWEHSLTVAQWSKTIADAQSGNPKATDGVAVAAMLHDVGKLVLASKMPDEYQQTICLTEREQMDICQAESNVIGTTHAEVGAYLLGLWGLDHPVVEAVAFHHRPSDATLDDHTLLSAVHIADALAQETQPHQTIDLAYAERLGLSANIDEWRNARELHPSRPLPA